MALNIVELYMRPSAQNSLAWSDYAEIAVAAGEEVHLLLPNRDSVRNIQWTRLHINVVRFTQKEWPSILLPGPPDVPYIAREQRSNEVVCLSWSPPGLARHDRCALGILTSNAILSLWLPGPDPTSGTRWHRALVVNNVQVDTSIVPKQIQAFGWSPKKCNLREQCLAVLANDILFIIVIRRHGTQLHSSIIAHEPLPRTALHKSLQESVEASQCGSHVYWHSKPKGDSQDHDIWEEIIIINNGCMHLLRVPFDLVTETETSNCSWSLQSIQAHGSLSVVEDTIVFGHQNNIIVRESFSRGDALPQTLVSMKSWDRPVTITPFGTSSDASHASNIAVLLPLTGPLLVLNAMKLDMDAVHAFKDQDKSGLMQLIDIRRKEYGSDHGIGDRVSTRYHGMASFGNNKEWLALLASFAPSEQIVYQIKSTERAFLFFTHVSLESSLAIGASIGDNISLPWNTEVSEHCHPQIPSSLPWEKSDEYCQVPLCGQPLLTLQSVDDIPIAKCAGAGHTYARCSITRLAIQQPYISKRCEGCSRQYLDEEKLGDDKELLANVLRGHPRCPFCGGRFLG